MSLVGGATKRQGDIQIDYHDRAGLICDDLFDVNDGHVICRMAGFPYVYPNNVPNHLYL